MQQTHFQSLLTSPSRTTGKNILDLTGRARMTASLRFRQSDLIAVDLAVDPAHEVAEAEAGCSPTAGGSPSLGAAHAEVDRPADSEDAADDHQPGKYIYSAFDQADRAGCIVGEHAALRQRWYSSDQQDHGDGDQR